MTRLLRGPAADVATLLRARADDHHPGLLFEDSSYSWAEIVAEAAARAALAQNLRQPGPFHVGVLLENVPDYLFWLSAAALGGATVVGVNPTRRGEELARDIRHTDCQILVTDRQHLPLLQGLDIGVSPERVVLIDDPDHAGQLSFYRGADPPEREVHPSDRLLLMFTSGSTGAPKAVVCSQGRLAGIALASAGMFEVTRNTVTYNALPLFHGNAVMANWAPVLHVGGTFAMRRRFSASEFIPDVRRFGASFFNYVGRTLAYVLATPERPDDSDNPLRLGFGTEASSRDRDRFTQRFGCQLIETYGSSEGAVSLVRTPDTPRGALGRPPAGQHVAILDPATKHECPTAEFDESGGMVNGDVAIGELVGVGSAGRFEGYYKNPAATTEHQRNGNYWTGDLGYRDKAGWYYFAGRTVDRLRVDGENFAAAPVEEILHRFPGIVLAAVFPVPDPQTGDQVMAVLEMASTFRFDPKRFGEFLSAQRDLGTKWAPRFVRLVADMPRTASNKTHKPSLRKAGWVTNDPVYWRPGRGLEYVELTSADRAALEREWTRHHQVRPFGIGPSEQGNAE